MAEQGGRGVMSRACMAGAIGWMIVLDSAKEVQGPICGRGSNTNSWNHLETLVCGEINKDCIAIHLREEWERHPRRR